MSERMEPVLFKCPKCVSTSFFPVLSLVMATKDSLELADQEKIQSGVNVICLEASAGAYQCSRCGKEYSQKEIHDISLGQIGKELKG